MFLMYDKGGEYEAGRGSYMELSVSLEYVVKQRGTAALRPLEEGARLAKAAGFHIVDYTPNLTRADWAENARRERAILDEAGITVEQTHAPMNRYGAHRAEDFRVLTDRAYEVSAILGARYIAVHADECGTREPFDERVAPGANYEYLAPYVEKARSLGLKVAIENLFEEDGDQSRKTRYTSRIDELVDIIERFNDPMVGCCWDFGHARCAFGDAQEQAYRQAARYVCCTHVHDNYYGKDLHLPPFYGDIDWEGMMQAMRETGYAGSLSFELVYGHFPDALLPGFLRGVHEAGEYLKGLFEAK